MLGRTQTKPTISGAEHALDAFADRLDQARAGSMADEGGAAGAIIDADTVFVLARPRPQRRWLAWGAVATAALLFATGYIALRARRFT